jgi:hypothetical protein
MRLPFFQNRTVTARASRPAIVKSLQSPIRKAVVSSATRLLPDAVRVRANVQSGKSGEKRKDKIDVSDPDL